MKVRVFDVPEGIYVGQVTGALVMATGKTVFCGEAQKRPLVVEIRGGAPEDIKKIQKYGWKVEMA